MLPRLSCFVMNKNQCLRKLLYSLCVMCGLHIDTKFDFCQDVDFILKIFQF